MVHNVAPTNPDRWMDTSKRIISPASWSIIKDYEDQSTTSPRINDIHIIYNLLDSRIALQFNEILHSQKKWYREANSDREKYLL